MGAIKGVIEKTVYSEMTPLDRIRNKKEWPDQIYRQAGFARSRLNTDLKTALDIIEQFEKHRAWEYSPHKNREDFYRYWVKIDPDNIPNILEGYRVLVAQGLTPTHWRQAIEAVRPLGKHGYDEKREKVGVN